MIKDMTGKTFGRLTVLEKSSRKASNGTYYWKCKCDCGTVIEVIGTNLRNGHTKSCGCLQKEISAKNNFNDLTGKRFGKLIVIEKTSKRDKSGAIIWKCRCDCGNEIEIHTSGLVTHGTNSCGCVNSRGELKISQLLRENNISFNQQKTFNDCRYPDTNYLAKFDFYVDNKYLIEYDGIYHFEVAFSWGTQEKLQTTQQHDKFKNQWCKENNIPLIRIPYTRFQNLSIKDLLLEEGNKFIVNEHCKR